MRILVSFSIEKNSIFISEKGRCSIVPGLLGLVVLLLKIPNPNVDVVVQHSGQVFVLVRLGVRNPLKHVVVVHHPVCRVNELLPVEEGCLCRVV